MRLGAILSLVLALAVVGCKSSDKRGEYDAPIGGRSGAEFSSRPRELRDTKDNTGHWVEGPYAAKQPRGNAPPADSYVDPSDPSFDTKTETRGVISGFVVDPEGRKAGKLFVQVEPLPSDGTGAPLEVETLADGSFLMKGLQPGQSYRLTTRVTDGTRIMAGRTDTKAPNTSVRLSLIEGLVLDDVKPGKESPPSIGRQTPRGSLPPITNVPSVDKSTPSDGGAGAPLPPPNLSSLGATASQPIPQPLSPEKNFIPTGGDLPQTGGWSPTSPAFTEPAPARSDLSTTGPSAEWKPPTATIPLPSPPPLVPLPVAAPPGRSRSQVVRSVNRFTLADSDGRSRTFPRGTEGELILLDFMTTTCLPCQRAVPTLVELQRKYGARGLEVVGVACDDESLQTRISVAEKYRMDHELNYGMYTETTRKPGELMKKFGVDRYPTVVLLDATGAVLWQGHPNKKDQLVSVIEAALRDAPR